MLQVNKCRVNMFVELRYMTIYGKKTETRDHCREPKRSMWAGWRNICPAMSLFSCYYNLLDCHQYLIDYVFIHSPRGEFCKWKLSNYLIILQGVRVVPKTPRVFVFFFLSRVFNVQITYTV